MGRPLGAQLRSSVEAGFAYARFPEEDVAAFGPSLRLGLRRELSKAFLAGDASLLGSGGGVAGGATALGGWHAPVTTRLRGELTAELAGVVGGAGRSSASSVVGARMSGSLGDGGAWVRVEGSASRRELGTLWGRGVGAGGWRRWPTAVLTAALVREWAQGQLFTTGSMERAVAVVPVRYTEAMTVLTFDGGAASFTGGASLRHDPDATSTLEAGGQATLAVTVRPGRALVLGIASQLPDYVRGADASRLVSVGLRVTDGKRGDGWRRRTGVVVQVRGDSSSRAIVVRAPGASRVEVMGEFSGWEPLALRRDGDCFVAAAALGSGTHRLVVRIDGGSWRPAANTPAVDDDFGGRVGLLVVP